MSKIKSLLCLCLVGLMCISVAGCGNSSDKKEEETHPTYVTTDSKTLVVYFSESDSVKSVATKIAKKLNADTFAIEPSTPYSDDDLDMNNEKSKVCVEQADDTSRPGIKNTLSNIGDYDTILIGYPVWKDKAPRIIYTFLESYDFAKKTVITFTANGDGDIEGTGDDLETLCSSSTKFYEDRAVKNDNDDVSTWLKEIGLK